MASYAESLLLSLCHFKVGRFAESVTRAERSSNNVARCPRVLARRPGDGARSGGAEEPPRTVGSSAATGDLFTVIREVGQVTRVLRLSMSDTCLRSSDGRTRTKPSHEPAFPTLVSAFATRSPSVDYSP